MSQPPLKAPFPYFGGKSRVAEEVWKRLGDVPNFVEPFFGSGAVLLARPHTPSIETVNDLNGFVANFWRAVKADPEAVAYHADQPVVELDLHARHLWLVNEGRGIVDKLLTDPDFYDPKVAGWWVWGACCFIGSGWCSGKGSFKREEGENGVSYQLPELVWQRGVNRGSDKPGGTQGVKIQLPYMTYGGRGVNQKITPIGERLPIEGACAERAEFVLALIAQLADRLRHVRVICGDWRRVVSKSVTYGIGVTGIFLDPPYGDDADCDQNLYNHNDGDLSRQVREWAIANGDNPKLRIALCGYEGEHEMPPSWEKLAWKANGGYGSQGDAQGRENARRERVWFSPHCLKVQKRPTQASLFGALEENP